MLRTLLVPALLLPTLAFAAGGGSSTPPTSTNTTKVCEQGYVYDDNTRSCVAPQESSLTDDDRYEAVRELAYAGRYNDAQIVLSAMDQADDRTLTYWGFTHRKMGNTELAMVYYNDAITTNPNNILARSYMGQAHAIAGDKDLAMAQLVEIKARGGRETWAEKSLEWAIERGVGYSY